jgi:25S rRNA (adenine2142-N1)-methyltransferase
VGTPQGRYEMLKRTTLFLRRSQSKVFPALFIVLPLPCVENSRYLTNEHFLEIMASLGYILIESRFTKRMAYWLFHWNGKGEQKEWKKQMIREGGGRNNFAIAS